MYTSKICRFVFFLPDVYVEFLLGYFLFTNMSHHQNERKKGYSCNTDSIVNNLFTDSWLTQPIAMTKRKNAPGNMYNMYIFSLAKDCLVTTGTQQIAAVARYLSSKPSLIQIICDNNNINGM